jgi:AcrR family transcriptional regulator
VPGERLRDKKRDETRQRLLDAANRLFGEQGYDHTTSAQIAQAAGVTERTLFRHFDSKADLMLGNWRSHAAAFREAMAAQPDDAPPIDVVRAGLRVWAQRLERGSEQEPEQTMAALGARLPVLTMLEIVLANEAFIAAELGRRLGRSDEDVDIRIAANASVGVFRAAARARVVERGRGPLPRTVSRGLDQLAPLFDALERRTTSVRSGARRSSPRRPPERRTDTPLRSS